MRTLLLGVGLSLVALSPGLARAQDADGDGVVDAADAFPCDPALSTAAFAPAEDERGTLFFEDQWPQQGDLDFNDAVVAYHYDLRGDAAGAVELRATFDVLALGGRFDNGLGLQLPVAREAVAYVRRRVNGGEWEGIVPSATDANFTVRVERFLRERFGGGVDPYNSLPDQPRQAGVQFELEIVFASPVAVDMSEAPFDVFLFNSHETSHEIHRPMYGGTSAMNAALFNTGDDASTAQRRFVDFTGMPYVLEVPASTPYAAEGTPISALFPAIATFAASGGTEGADYYTTPEAAASYVDAQGQGMVGPAALDARPADFSCVLDPFPAPNAVARSGGCYWSFNGNATMNGHRSVSMAGAGIPGSKWVRIDYGTPTAITAFASNAWNGTYRQGGIQDFRVQYSDDASTWTTHYSGRHPNASGTHVHTFEMATARYWRFVIDSVWIRRSTSCGYGQFQGNFQFRNP